MTNFNDFLNEQMKDPEFKAEWDALDPEFSEIEAMLKARKESGLTQQQLSLKSRSFSLFIPHCLSHFAMTEPPALTERDKRLAK